MQVIKHDISKKRVGSANKRLGHAKRLKSQRGPTVLRSVTEASLKAEICPRCDSEEKLRHREFSTQATAALVVWGEIQEKVVGVPICEGCYDELREVLIERNEEINNPKPDRRPVIAKQTVNAKAAVVEPIAAPVKVSKGKETKETAAKTPAKAVKSKESKETKGKKAPPAKKTVSAKSKNAKTVATKGKKVKKAS